MSFLVDKKIFGTEKHFLVDSGRFAWVLNVPRETWWLDGNLKLQDTCLDTLLRLNDVNVSLEPPRRFVNAMQVVWSGSVPWELVMPSRVHRMFMRDVVENVTEAIKHLDKGYYERVWVPGNNVFRSLKRAKINKQRWQSLMDAGVGNLPVIATFKPQAGGYASEPIYNRFGTRTGRTTITDGPSMLTLKKEYRGEILESRWGEEGVLLNIDFSNLEPRILLYEAGKRCEHDDLYTFLNLELFGGKGSRSVIKGAVISELYGISKFVLQRKLNVPWDTVDEFCKKISTYFETKKLLHRVKTEFIKKGYLSNRFGRRVTIDEPQNHIFINSYAQSTGADIALLGFNQLIKERFVGKKIVPLFVLSDALIVDAHKSEAEFVSSLNKITVDGYIQSFRLSVADIPCTRT